MRRFKNHSVQMFIMDKDWRPKASDNQFEKITVEKRDTMATKPSNRMDEAPVFENGIDMGEPLEKTKLKYIGLACLGLVILAFIVFFGARAVTGYAVYDAMEESGVPSEYVTNMVGLQSELTTTQSQLVRTVSDLEQERIVRQEKDQQVQQLSSQNDQLSTKLGETERLADALEGERDEARGALEVSARQLCCVQRVLTPEIDSYGLVDGVIVCGKGRTVKISC